ncbi:MAG: hypothetical protein KAQ85_08720, partial [Thermodesulfovibrionia bacterium]|nr:hypothetical protein [Thermodesulfovibrionia bacterium]
MPKSNVRSHPRKGTKGVKSHSRELPSNVRRIVPHFRVPRIAQEPHGYREQTAQTILDQIGGDTLAYVGALGRERQWMYGFVHPRKDDPKDVFVQFPIKGSKIQRGGKIKVIYNYQPDTYTVELWRIHMGAKEPVKKLRSSEGVYAESLSRVIEDY